MTLVWEVVPTRLHYFRPAVEACVDAIVRRFDETLGRHVSFAERATREQLDLLAALQAEITQRADAHKIDAWRQAAFDGTQAEKEAAVQIGAIMAVLRQFAKNDVAPFCDAPLPEPCQPADEALDDTLPDELQYLIAPALDFGGRYVDEGEMSRFSAVASTEEAERLAALAEKVRLCGDWPRIHAWFCASDRGKVRYGVEIDRLFNLIDLCDLPFEPES